MRVDVGEYPECCTPPPLRLHFLAGFIRISHQKLPLLTKHVCRVLFIVMIPPHATVGSK